jgi:prevent-host-death family protein
VETIGIRELRQHASVWLAKVKAGATIQITDRGQPVARLVPIKAAEHARSTLIAAGRLIPATAPRVTFSLDRLVQGASLSSALGQQRADR